MTPSTKKSTRNEHFTLIAALAICGLFCYHILKNARGVRADNSVTVSMPAINNQWYVSPAGSSSGNGTQAHPWDLATALMQPSSVHAGDEIWLEAGTYGNGTVQFNSVLTGTASSPIIVRAIPGQRATINGGLVVNGAYTWYWGFEVANFAVTNRDAVFINGFDIFGQGTRFINLIVHDTGEAFGFWKQAVDAEIYGSLMYYNGYDLPDRGHGHGLYVQNDCTNGSNGGPIGPKNIENNIVFRQFGNGTQLYGTSSVCGDNTTYRGNTFFNNGEPSIVSGMVYNMWIGAGGGELNVGLINNHMYAPSWAGQEWNRVYKVTNGQIVNNYFVAPDVNKNNALAFQPGNVNLTMTGNTFFGLTDFQDGGYSTSSFPNNTYLAARPAQNVVFVDPNKYELGRANITVYNWQLLSGVNVDISTAGLHTGDTYELLDAENFFGPPVVTGTYTAGQPITIPMSNLTAVPVFSWTYVPKTTGPEFGAFVLIPLSETQVPTPALAQPVFEPVPGMVNSTGPGSSTPTTPVPPTISSFGANPGSITQGQSSLLTWTVTNASTIFIDNGVGLVTGSSVSVSPLSTTTFTLSASNSGGPTNKTVTVTVTQPVTVPTGGGTTTAPTGPAAYWSFDSASISNGQVQDLSGNGATATIVNTSSITGVSEQAMQLSGSNSYLSAGNPSNTDLSGNMTLNAWIKTRNTTRSESIISRYDSAGVEYGYLFKILPSGVLDLRFGGNNVAGTRDVTDTTKINDGSWHMVTAVINLGSNVQFYVDGKLSSTQAIAAHSGASGAPLLIGSIPYLYYATYFSGSMDEVRVYGRALSATDVLSLYQTIGGTSTMLTPPPVATPPVTQPIVETPASLTQNLASEWTFDTGTIVNGLVTDVSGNGATAQEVNVASVQGINGLGLHFNGNNSYLNANNPANTELMGDLTLNAWIRTTNNTRSESIISRYNSGAAEYGYLFKTTAAGFLDVRFGGNNVTGTRDVTDTTKINDGAWHMVTAVINLGSNVQFYVDGNLSSTRSIPSHAGVSGTGLLIGAIAYPAYATFYTGDMDSVRIYDRALSASDLTALFQSQ